MSENKYLKLNKIGEGTYGKVYKGLNTKTSEVVAMKIISTEKDGEGIPGTALREVTLLRELLDHQNIIKIKDVRIDIAELVIILEYLPLDLAKYMWNNQLSMSSIKTYMYQISDAISYCHNRRIIHRDLKPDNILMTKDGKIKIADFGLARALSSSRRLYSKEVVTLWYRAPELLLGTMRYSREVDIWSLGCIFIEMLMGRPIFKGNTEINQLKEIFRIMSIPDAKLWPMATGSLDGYVDFKTSQNINKLPQMLQVYGEHVLNFAQCMLTYDPKQRWTSTKLLTHAFFTKIDQPKNILINFSSHECSKY